MTTSRTTLAGKHCLITGASGGLGKVLSKQFADAGCHLHLLGRKQSELTHLASNIRDDFPALSIETYQIDFLDSAALSQLATEINQQFEIDILINNAGIFPVSLLQNSSVDDFDNCMAVNVKAPFLLTKTFSASMKNRGWGRIVNIGSSSAYSGFAKTSVYCASKHALLGFSRAINDELKHDGVRSFCLSPGSVQTPMGERVEGQDYSTFISPEDIAEYSVFLVSFNGNMMTDEVRMNRVNIQ